MSHFPKRVRVREVGPRDGFQNEPEVLPTELKVRLIEMLGRTGVPRIELTSFVRPDRIPQLADAEAVLSTVQLPDAVSVSLLIPNVRGLERALPYRDRFQEINGFLSASESHNQSNLGRSIADSLAGVVTLFELARREGLKCEGVISCSFGCPFEGQVPVTRPIALAAALVEAGAAEIAFADTTGMANPRQVGEFFASARAALPGVELTAHFHNTRGQGLANVLAALEVGIESFESSFGELGGCPFADGATGNVATEDVVSMLHEMGIETGIDLGRLIDAARAAQDALGRTLGSHVLAAGPPDWR
jgi:hydroxymethylglutaryl-CoA lyase